MSNNNKTPAIRFKGFTDTWEQRKLGECAEFNPKSELPDIFEYVDLESVVGTDILSHRTESKSSAPSRAQRLAQKGDVFYQTVRPYQKNNCIFENDENNWVFSTGYAQLRPVNDGYFLLTLLQNEDFVKLVLDRCTGTSYPAINSNDLADIDVNIPINNLEQQRIGDYFRNLDSLITLHQRKYEKLVNIKKSMLDKMFPPNGVSVPEIRFKGFTDPWEQRKLDEIANFSKGVGYSKNDLCEEGTPIILYGRLYTKYETSIFDVDTFVKEKAGSVYSKGGEVIVPASGETAEDISIASVVVKPGILLGGDLNIVSPTTEYDSAFLALTISSGATHKYLSSLAQGKSVVHLHNADIQSVSAKFPTKREQEKIHLLFGKIDTLITLHQRKLEKLQNIKKSCLEKMFV